MKKQTVWGVWVIVGLLTGLNGCASMGGALTPSAKVVVDEYDGSTAVQQAPVNAGMGYALGFDWSSRTPDTVFVSVRVFFEYVSITDVWFNADGIKIESAQAVDNVTHFEHGEQTSTRRFSMPMADFVVVARAQDVRMRVGKRNEYSVTKFGPANGPLIVNTKFGPFLEKIAAAGAELPPV